MLMQARGLTLTRDNRVVLDSVSFAIEPEQIMTVVGPNGAGKTTLLRLLLGLELPSSGDVLRKPGLRVGYMPQKLPLNALFPITVHRFLSLRSGYSRADIDRALSLTGVASLAQRSMETLSGGELQRVLLARAILHEPELLVLDEPVQGVDFMGEAALYRLIQSLKETLRCSVLMVSHDLHVVMAATDRVICLNGHVCCFGAPETVESHPDFIDLFGRRDARTLGLYHHHHGHEHGLHDQGGPVANG